MLFPEGIVYGAWISVIVMAVSSIDYHLRGTEAGDEV
jgi:hypothetical protein